MKFAYTYRSSDGQRRKGEIEAESRDAAFAKVRAELGIKPIKVTAAPGGAVQGSRGSSGWKGGIVAAAALAAAGLGAWWWFAGARDARPYRVVTPQGTVTLSVATPLPRQAIPGDRQRIADAIAGAHCAFKHDAEAYLARYAEPGREIPRARQAAAGGFEAVLRDPIRIASTDFTEVVDLKRIVTGMKREMLAYLAGGGTVDGYLAELDKRQRLEAAYRENAEKRLAELLSEPRTTGGASRPRRAAAHPEGSPHLPNHQPPTTNPGWGEPSSASRLKEAYEYWLKANASLKSMGIYELPLPDALRRYQLNLDIDD